MAGLITLVTMAVTASLLWLGGAAVYVDARIGWDNIFSLYPTELATLAAAAFTPVAGLWLVIGFIGNGLSVNQQNKSMSRFLWQAQRSAEHTETLARTLVEMRAQAGHEAFFKNLDLVLADLNDLIASISLRGGLLTQADRDGLWRRVAGGDKWAFTRPFLDAADADPGFIPALGALAQEDKNLRRDVFTFFRHYEKLMELTREHDTDGMVYDVLEDGGVTRVLDVLAKAGEFRADLAAANVTRQVGVVTGPAREGLPQGVKLSPAVADNQVAEEEKPHPSSLTFSQPTSHVPPRESAPARPAYVPPPPPSQPLPPSQPPPVVEQSAPEPRAPEPQIPEPQVPDRVVPMRAEQPDVAEEQGPADNVAELPFARLRPLKKAATDPSQSDDMAKRPNLVASLSGAGQPFSPLAPGFPKDGGWPEESDEQ